MLLAGTPAAREMPCFIEGFEACFTTVGQVVTPILDIWMSLCANQPDLG